jgi:hypothetical protein
MNGRDEGRRRRRRHGNFSPRREEQEREAGASRERSKNRRSDRLHWIPPKLNTEPLPEPKCAYCGRPIQDIGSAFDDRASGAPVHFNCVIARLLEGEKLEKGDILSYIGGGRFGIVHFNESRAEFRNRFPPDLPGRVFTIKKIFEWEDRNHRPDWRVSVADHYSIT